MKPLERRTLLRGIGTAIALPWLEAMTPVSRAAMRADEKPIRMLFVMVPNGIHMADWTPTSEGSKFELPATLRPLEKHRNSLNVFTGLTLDGARDHGDGAGDHARSGAAFLTGAHPKKTDGADIKNGISVDQVAAQGIGQKSKFASLELGLEGSAQSGNCDSGYSCAYSSNLAWRNESSPLAKEMDPSAVFERLFGTRRRSPMLHLQAYEMPGEKASSIMRWKMPSRSKSNSAPLTGANSMNTSTLFAMSKTVYNDPTNFSSAKMDCQTTPAQQECLACGKTIVD